MVNNVPLFLFVLLSGSLWSQKSLWQDHVLLPEKADSTFLRLKASLNKNEHLGSKNLLAKDHLRLGEFYADHGIFSEAVPHFNSAMQLLKDAPKDTLHVLLYHAIGKVDFTKKNFELAAQYFAEGEQIAADTGYTKGQAISSTLLGSSYEKLKEYTTALDYQERAKQLFTILKDTLGIAIVNGNIGSIHEDLGENALAKDYFLRSYESVRGMGTPLEANILNNLGDVDRRMGHYGQSIFYYEKALELAGTISEYQEMKEAAIDLSKIYNIQNNHELAYEYLEKANRYNNELQRIENSDQLNILHTVYEMDRNESQMALLQEQEKTNDAKQNFMWLAIFSLAVITIVGYLHLSRKKQIKLKLQDYERQLLKTELDKKEREVQLKASTLSKYSLLMSKKNKMLHELSLTLKNMAYRNHMDLQSKIRDLSLEIDSSLHQEEQSDEFLNFFKEVHPGFIKKLSSLSNDSLSPSEMRLAMLLRLNLSSKEIASVLGVTQDTVRVARYRLRKKLPIDSREELATFMVDIDLSQIMARA